ncbi:hypothetical protein [Paenibacillus sp. MY03]|uniref:hypothetical protein n=1 Tax=Paenibacillus sp. MY03 TaxID=302980 RepID=UPI0015C5BCB9|nr:hypothetical protein [Paenibacillus sp. MY03]
MSACVQALLIRRAAALEQIDVIDRPVRKDAVISIHVPVVDGGSSAARSAAELESHRTLLRIYKFCARFGRRPLVWQSGKPP